MSSNCPQIIRYRGKRPLRSGLTLAELLVSMIAATILLAGLTSAIVLVSRAGRWGPAEIVQTGMEVGDILAELQLAAAFRERGTHAVEFAVSDRDSDGQAEWIRYAWSGVPGDPVTRQVNQGPATKILDSVHALLLRYDLQAAVDDKARVLLVVPNAASLSDQDAAKRSWMESWGYRVKPISASSPRTDFTAAELEHDVAFISEQTDSSDLNDKLLSSPLGVVNEEPNLYDDLELASEAGSFTSTYIDITNNAHYITSQFTLSSRVICEPSQSLFYGRGTLAPGVTHLAQRPASSTGVLMTLEAGEALLSGQRAVGRRVMLPWGGTSFDFHALTYDGQVLLDRALTWAAGNVLVAVGLSVQPGPQDHDHVVSRTAITNRPRVSGP